MYVKLFVLVLIIFDVKTQSKSNIKRYFRSVITQDSNYITDFAIDPNETVTDIKHNNLIGEVINITINKKIDRRSSKQDSNVTVKDVNYGDGDVTVGELIDKIIKEKSKNKKIEIFNDEDEGDDYYMDVIGRSEKENSSSSTSPFTSTFTRPSNSTSTRPSNSTSTRHSISSSTLGRLTTASTVAYTREAKFVEDEDYYMDVSGRNRKGNSSQTTISSTHSTRPFISISTGAPPTTVSIKALTRLANLGEFDYFYMNVVGRRPSTITGSSTSTYTLPFTSTYIRPITSSATEPSTSMSTDPPTSTSTDNILPTSVSPEASSRVAILAEDDDRKGICLKYMSVLENVEVTTTGNHYVHNHTKCCFNDKYECMRPWYHKTVLSYYKTLRTWTEKEVCCDGYTLDRQKIFDDQGRILCAPVCEKPCVKAKCTKPNECACLLGYKKQKDSKNECIPECKNDCGGSLKGVCVSPEKCLCKRGFQYKKGTVNTCETQCPIKCVNARCTGPSTCKCLPGYKRHNTNRYKCIPICTNSCEHGQCVAPSKCVCNRGYRFEKGHCKPICNVYCGAYGTCAQNGECKCDPGYQFDKRIKECVPKCKNCRGSGICVKPNQCKCFPGFQPNKEGGCVFGCSFACGLGRCVGKDKCLCHKGYIFNETEKGPKCVPFCPGCEIGECISPNHCICPKGYVYVIPKTGHDRTLKCMKINKKHKYYDHKECKSIYAEMKRKADLDILKKKKRIGKLKWEEARQKRLKIHKEKLAGETETKRYYFKHNVPRPKDKTIRRSKQKKDLEILMQKKKKKDERIRKMYASYRQDFDKPEVTWQKFARVTLASVFLGPFGIIFW